MADAAPAGDRGGFRGGFGDRGRGGRGRGDRGDRGGRGRGDRGRGRGRGKEEKVGNFSQDDVQLIKILENFTFRNGCR